MAYYKNSVYDELFLGFLMFSTPITLYLITLFNDNENKNPRDDLFYSKWPQPKTVGNYKLFYVDVSIFPFFKTGKETREIVYSFLLLTVRRHFGASPLEVYKLLPQMKWKYRQT